MKGNHILVWRRLLDLILTVLSAKQQIGRQSVYAMNIQSLTPAEMAQYISQARWFVPSGFVLLFTRTDSYIDLPLDV